ncbi:glutathione S-transferase family protein [Variovorax sp. MHTC-1]|uniref:glutathione S-transferase family protein n=1 Tax=Variovorax sp. MHTC-1 TaxID=2495593 RepID=UPI000F894F00|nr:glutathione S-transferase [Variovorax sp. MHTC-1]RST54525.1 glutathione S-transferase [Variovorax sp. MHTC-1]
MYRLHCFAQSGNSFKVAFLLRALGQPFETVFVDYMQGGLTRDPAWRETLNEMGEAPVLEDGPLRLTQSGVILTHLADKHGAYGGRTPEDRREILRWLLFDNHKFTSYFASYRFAKSFGASAPDPAVMAWLMGRIDAAYGVVERHLSASDFIVGAEPTIADFSLSGYLFYPAEESGIDVAARYPHIAAWVGRLRGLPGWAPPYDVLPGERIAPRW